MFNDKTAIPVGMMSIKAIEDLPANRFVNYQGGLCNNDELILGVTTKSWKAGETAAICFAGIVVVEAEEIINSIGLPMASGDYGKIKKSLTNDQNIVNLNTAAAIGKTIRVKM